MTTRYNEIKQHATDISNTWLPQDYQQVAYDAAVKMAEWCDYHPREGLWDSEKVIEWIKNNFSCSGYGFPLHYHHVSYQPEDIIKDLQKAMED